MNNCTFMGNLTRDPKVSETKTGSIVVTFGMATNRFFKRPNGEMDSEATFLEMECWDTGGQRMAEMFKKGDSVLVETSAKNNVWIDRDGNEQRKLVFRINHFYPLARKPRQLEEDNGRPVTWFDGAEH